MPRGRPRKKPKSNAIIKPIPTEKSEPLELEEYIQEANEVHQLVNMRGWAILKRDLKKYREGIINKLAYINKNRPEFDELRINFLAADKLIMIVEDYKVNKDKMVDYLNTFLNPDVAISYDVDNE